MARSKLDDRDRRLVKSLVQTTHRWRGRADRVLDRRLKRGVRSLDPRTLNILRLGYVQLFHLEQIPPHAAVHTAVDAAWRFSGEGKSRLVNKILRGLISRPPEPKEWQWGRGVERLEGELSHPTWLLERWVKRWGEERTTAICHWNNEPPDFHLRLCRGPQDAASVTERLKQDGIKVEAGAVLKEALRVNGTFDVRSHPLLTDGAIAVQDESQMLVGHLWPDREAGPVLDICAAPGTKTAHIAELSPSVSIFASDAALRRMRRVTETMTRLGHDNVHALVADARKAPFAGGFRRVLVDAPCTSLGVLRRRPDARWLRSPGEIPDAAQLQRALLDAAAALLRPGGWLLYSVCTLEPEETDRQAAGFRERHTEFHIEDLPAWLPEEIRVAPGELRVLPGTLGMEGLYVALFRKRDESAKP
jgi:16S rRNA (cytosine967-C5)-methyltransferase